MTRPRISLFVVIASAFASIACAADDQALAQALRRIRAVQPQGAGHREAVAAAKVASAADGAKLIQVLAALDGANPIAENWLRGVAEAVAQRAAQDRASLPLAELEKFLADTKRSPRGRRLAYEVIARVDPAAEGRLIPTLVNDPSLELRRDAVALLLARAEKVEGKQATIVAYEKALHHARDLDQIKVAAGKLKELEAPADVATHMGFVMKWHLIGPFDNVDDKGWDVAYPPELNVNLVTELDGQKGKVRWTDAGTTHEYGVMDLNKLLDKHKGAVAYAYAGFQADRERPCELRLGSINATKLWLNGELLMEKHVYHAGEEIDQYVARGTLKKGKNAILLKICQNEQTEAWAQSWQFQLRVCDEIGTAILSQDRPTRKVATLAH